MVVLTNLPPPTEGVRHTEKNTVAVVGEKNLGDGTLYIAESCVAWTNPGGEGFNLQYPSISLHAVSRDQTAFPQQCLYIMLDSDITDKEPSPADTGSGGEEEEEENQADMTEVRFIPQDNTALDPMFQAMSGCQMLHPDPEDLDSDEEEYEEDGCGDAEYFEDAEGFEHLTEEGRATLAHLESVIQVPGVGNGQAGEFSQTMGGVHAELNGRDDDDTTQPTEPMEVGQFDDADPEK
ncbi:methylosome subunit pICln-like [Branchiostoma floridae x Branchiostoma japonicum]